MRVDWTPEQLFAFEEDIAQSFLRKEVLAPIHLAGGNERQLIEIFREHVNESDWVLGQWRSHYHCLLKGVPPEKVKAAILAGKSISLCFPEYRILCSGIAGGIAPIAVGIAMGIQRKGEAKQRKVCAFLGDMTAEMGCVHEAMKYADSFELPILWVIEDNGLSVQTPTDATWGELVIPAGSRYGAIRYRYTLSRPHVGCGKWVSF